MERGDIYWVNLEPTVGSESDKLRPCLIVSNNANNRAASTLTVLPITSQVEMLFPFEVLLESELDRPSKIQASQVRTISKHRIDGSRLARLPPEIMTAVDAAIRLHLAI